MSSEYNFDALSTTQLRVLGQISVNNDEGHPKATIRTLLRKGMIEEYEDGYYMPIHVHVRWCQWCSENYQNEEGYQEGD